jgi:hypothetical protein
MNSAQAFVQLAILYVAFTGALFAAFPVGGALQKVILLSACAVALSMQLASRLPRAALAPAVPLLAYVVLATLSAYQVSGSMVYTLAAVQPFLVCAILYATLVSSRPDTSDLRMFANAFLALCAIQFGFSLIKLGIHGVDEKFLIGTMSHVAGQIGFLFPAIATPILVYIIRQRRQPWLYLLLAAMFAFGIINEKRSVVFLMPVILVASLVANRHPPLPGSRPAGVGAWLAALGIAAATVLLGLRAVPSLNPEESYSGSISLSFALEYAWTYLTMDYGGSLQSSYEQAVFDENVQVGRIIVVLDILRWLIHADWHSLLFGMGFGTVTPSEWLPDSDDPLFKALGTRGAISGAGLAVLETGLVGLSLFVLMFGIVIMMSLRQSRRTRSLAARQWLRTVLVIVGVFAFDFFFYSTALLRTLPLPYLFFLVVASVPVAAELGRRKPGSTP